MKKQNELKLLQEQFESAIVGWRNSLELCKEMSKQMKINFFISILLHLLWLSIGILFGLSVCEVFK